MDDKPEVRASQGLTSTGGRFYKVPVLLSEYVVALEEKLDFSILPPGFPLGDSNDRSPRESLAAFRDAVARCAAAADEGKPGVILARVLVGRRLTDRVILDGVFFSHEDGKRIQDLMLELGGAASAKEGCNGRP